MMLYMDKSTYDAYLHLEGTGDHKMAGYVGKILRVNLTKGKIAKEDISDQIKDRFLGGRGFAVKILWDEVKGVDPYCNARCGIVVKDAEGGNAEVDYENITMLGSNIGITDLGEAAALNRLADEYGLDTISLGSNLAFLMEASEKGLIDEKLQWGDFDGCKRVIAEIVNNKGLGQIVYGGVKKAAERLGSESNDWAMEVKGMEISAYTCQSLPGMALA